MRFNLRLQFGETGSENERTEWRQCDEFTILPTSCQHTNKGKVCVFLYYNETQPDGRNFHHIYCDAVRAGKTHDMVQEINSRENQKVSE